MAGVVLAFLEMRWEFRQAKSGLNSRDSFIYVGLNRGFLKHHQTYISSGLRNAFHSRPLSPGHFQHFVWRRSSIAFTIQNLLPDWEFETIFVFISFRKHPDALWPAHGPLRHRGRGRPDRGQDLGRHHELPEFWLRGHREGLRGLRNAKVLQARREKTPRFIHICVLLILSRISHFQTSYGQVYSERGHAYSGGRPLESGARSNFYDGLSADSKVKELIKDIKESVEGAKGFWTRLPNGEFTI